MFVVRLIFLISKRSETKFLFYETHIDFGIDLLQVEVLYNLKFMRNQLKTHINSGVAMFANFRKTCVYRRHRVSQYTQATKITKKKYNKKTHILATFFSCRCY